MVRKKGGHQSAFKRAFLSHQIINCFCAISTGARTIVDRYHQQPASSFSTTAHVQWRIIRSLLSVEKSRDALQEPS